MSPWPRYAFVVRFPLPILRQRATYIVRLLKPAARTTTDIAFVRASVDELSFPRCGTFGHVCLQCYSLSPSESRRALPEFIDAFGRIGLAKVIR